MNLRVDLIDTRPGKRGVGHPSWEVNARGAKVEDDGIIVEVRPDEELAAALDANDYPTSRSYDEIVRICQQAETNGGFGRKSHEIHVGDDVLTGRDVVEFLTTMWRRASERVGAKDAVEEALRQGYDAGLRDAAAEFRRGVAGLRSERG